MKILAMGGYGLYVWSAYGIAFTVLIGNVLWSIRARKKSWFSIRN